MAFIDQLPALTAVPPHDYGFGPISLRTSAPELPVLIPALSRANGLLPLLIYSSGSRGLCPSPDRIHPLISQLFQLTCCPSLGLNP